MNSYDQYKEYMEGGVTHVWLKHFASTPKADRLEELLKKLERFFPGELLNMLLEKSDARILENRYKDVESLLLAKRSFTIFNGERDQAKFRGVNFYCGEEMSHLTILLPPGSYEQIAEILSVAGDILEVFWAEWTPPAEYTVLWYQLNAAWKPHDISAGLPAAPEVMQFPILSLPEFVAISDLDIQDRRRPLFVGWLNYWSPETCALLGFPDLEKDSAVLKSSYKTPRGAWLVKLTEEPLDLQRMDHREIVKWAYTRFDEIGVRR